MPEEETEEILAEEQAGFKAGRSTTEQIFNVRLIIETPASTNRPHPQFHFIWHEGLWQVTRNYNFDEDLIQIIQALYAKSNNAVLLNNQLGELFRTTVGVLQGCPLSPVLFNMFPENIMQETLQDFNTTV